MLRHATNDPYNVSFEEVFALLNELFEKTVTYKDQSTLEVHIHLFQNYLYEYFEIKFAKSSKEIERIFENAASTAEPTKDIEVFLQFLYRKGIRSSVISNMSFSGSMLNERINRYIPLHKFEFVIASSEYVFRKPHKRIFELALKKARLEPCEVWYCGDNAICDVDGAANSGIFPIWYKGALGKINTYVPKSDYLEINDWNELLEFLDKNKGE